MFRNLPRYADMTETPVGWAPRLPRHWGLERGKSLFERVQREPLESDGVVTCFRDGMVTLRSRRRSTGYTESLKEIGYQGIRKGDLVIHAMDAFAGAAGVSDSDGKGTPVYSVCVPRRNANPHYYAAVVREMARSSWILALSKGVRERSTDFRFDMFGTQMLPVPTATEQSAIVKYLAHANARIDRAIAAQRRLIDLLDEQRRNVSNTIVTRGDGISTLVSSGVSWLGDVPAGWDVAPLKRYWSVTDCKHLTVPFTDEGFPLASVSQAQRFLLDLTDAKRTDLESYLSLIEGGRDPRAGDLIYCRNVGVGAAAVVETNESFAMGQDVCLLRSKDQNPYFLNLYLQSDAMRAQLESILVGSTFRRINVEDVRALVVVVPSIPEQKRLVELNEVSVAPMRSAIEKAQREIELLREFRTRLVADVVTGQVDVRAIAATLPDAPDEFDELDMILDDELEEALTENLAE